MFTDKFYSKVYFSTIEKAVKRGWKKALGRERHHIIPRSLGGSDDKSNLVYLTCREHFLCHWMLVKMTQGEARNKMLYALMGMRAENEHQNRYRTVFTARVYEHYRIEHARIHSETMKGRPAWNKGIPQTEEHKEKNRQAALKRGPRSKETIEKMKKSREGYKHSEETKLKQSLASKGKPKGPMSEEEKLKRSIKQKGVPKNKDHATNIKNAVLGNISINKDGKEKKVKQDTLDQWLAEGWMLGGRKRK
jgi:rubrerythrin